MKSLPVGAVGLLALMSGGAALAADLPAAPAPTYKAPPPVVAPSWTGFYVGVNGGLSVGHNRTTDTTVLPGITNPVFGADSVARAPFGGIVGGQVGWNWQAAPSWLLGIEADMQWSGQTDTACVSACLPQAVNGSLLGLTDDQKLTWFGTARGRVGWIAPNGTLWYATGGAAWGRVEQTLTLTGTAGFFPTGLSSTASFSHDRVGWTVGGGAETPLGGGWSAKAEYLFVDLGSVSNTFVSPLGLALLPATAQATNSSVRIQDHIVRFGLNYRFGANDAGYAPAAPLFTKAPQVAPRGWTGFYVGVNGGASLGRNHTNDVTAVTPVVVGGFPIQGNDSFNNSPIGGIFGGQAGWNWQAASSWLLGVEADAQWSGQDVTACVSACLPSNVPGSLLGLTDEQKLTWFGTARGRVGWIASNGTLWYATGGVAWGGVEQTLTLAGTPGFFPGTATTSAASFSQTKVGWTVGGGLEAPLAGNWTAKAEYLYMDLGNVTNSFSSALGAGAAPATIQTTTSTYEVRDHVVRVGLNYRFY
jgi:outer membrane immunogenic protein